MQKLRDGSFGKRWSVGKNENPTLDRAYSDIAAYQRFTLTKLFEGVGNFWGHNFDQGTILKKKHFFLKIFLLGSVIIFVFEKVQQINSIRISSGGDHPNDVIPASSEISIAKSGQTFDKSENADFYKDEYFQTIGLVGSDGNFEKSFSTATGDTIAVRIKMASKTKYWIWIYDIYIETILETKL